MKLIVRGIYMKSWRWQANPRHVGGKHKEQYTLSSQSNLNTCSDRSSRHLHFTLLGPQVTMGALDQKKMIVIWSTCALPQSSSVPLRRVQNLAWILQYTITRVQSLAPTCSLRKEPKPPLLMRPGKESKNRPTANNNLAKAKVSKKLDQTFQ